MYIYIYIYTYTYKCLRMDIYTRNNTHILRDTWTCVNKIMYMSYVWAIIFINTPQQHL